MQDHINREDEMLNTTGIEQASEGTVGALISAGLIFIGDDNRMHAAPEGTKAELRCRIQEETDE